MKNVGLCGTSALVSVAPASFPELSNSLFNLTAGFNQLVLDGRTVPSLTTGTLYLVLT